MKTRIAFKLEDLKKFSKKFDQSYLKYLKTIASSEVKVKAAMNYFIKTGGKRLRPFIIHKVGSQFGIMSSKTLELGFAIESLHLFSLIHDDLPGMDNDDLRRGKPTVHKKFDEATAILAGDMFLVLAFQILTTSKSLLPNQKLTLLKQFSETVGIAGLLGGQSLDIHMKNKSSLKQIENMYSLKTGALFSFCFNYIASLKKLKKPQIKNLKVLGDSFGKIFQITDDMLDRWGDEKKVGKKINKDANKANLAYVLDYATCQKYLNHHKLIFFRSLNALFNRDIKTVAYMSSFIDYITLRVK